MKGSVGSLYVFYLFDILSTLSCHYINDYFNAHLPNKTPWSGLVRSCMEGLLYKNHQPFWQADKQQMMKKLMILKQACSWRVSYSFLEKGATPGYIYLGLSQQ